MNIPIGVLPLSDTEAIAWSIPNIWRLIDTNGDGVADQKTVEFGPFGVVDTHGNQNAFTRWIDGWIYANHGFSNDSHVKMGGKGPDVLHMNSGNTYRFRPDGSAIEQFSWGQVNPFGLSFDPLGNLFSADCHSCAVTMLLREGYYQSFGKPHDGLGFAPEMTHIDHGGTGIAGVVYSTIAQFSARSTASAVRGQRHHESRALRSIEVGRLDAGGDEGRGFSHVRRSVVSAGRSSARPGRRAVHRRLLQLHHRPLRSAAHASQARSRTRPHLARGLQGRAGQAAPRETAKPMPDLQALDAPALFAVLKHPNLTVRVLATNLLVDKFPKEAAAMASELLSRELHARTGE